MSAVGTVAVKLYNGQDYTSVGASGALCGTIAFLALTSPFTTFYLYGIVKVPAWACAGGLFCWDLYSAVTDRRGSTRTDFWGHVMGSCAGAGYWFLLARRGRFVKPF
jgi:rhomboid-like protein